MRERQREREHTDRKVGHPAATRSLRNSRRNIDAIPITYDGCCFQFHHFYGDCLLLRLNSVRWCSSPGLCRSMRFLALVPFVSGENGVPFYGTLSRDNFFSTETDHSSAEQAGRPEGPCTTVVEEKGVESGFSLQRSFGSRGNYWRIKFQALCPLANRLQVQPFHCYFYSMKITAGCRVQ